jgi:hypothetical protein
VSTSPDGEGAAAARAGGADDRAAGYYGGGAHRRPIFDLNRKVTAEMLREREIAIHRSADQADHLS